MSGSQYESDGLVRKVSGNKTVYAVADGAFICERLRVNAALAWLNTACVAPFCQSG